MHEIKSNKRDTNAMQRIALVNLYREDNYFHFFIFTYFLRARYVLLESAYNVHV